MQNNEEYGRLWEYQYLNLIKKIVDEGYVQYNERTGKKCYFYLGDTMKFDLSSGYFPMLTTKKLFMRQNIAELLGFIRGFDNAKQFRDLGCNFWNANANESKHWLENPNRKGEDDLGRIYGVQARCKQSFFEVKKRHYNKPESQQIPLPVFEQRIPDYSNNISKIIGEQYNSNNCGPFIVLSEKRNDTGKHLLFDVKFLSTGFIKENVQISAIRRGTVKDPYYPSICGVAAYGQPKDKNIASLVKKSWRDMIYRCYSKKRRMNSCWYLDKDIFVDDRWLLFENFVEDFKEIDRWELKIEYPDMYSLDKDFYNSNLYSKHTCVWANKTEQNINTEQTKKFIAISPNGDVYNECGISNFSKKHNLNNRSARMALASNVKLGGWQFINNENNVSDYRIRIDDQLAHSIAKLKHNPSDRRIMVDHWNPNELHLMALPPCHMSYTFGLRDGYLDMVMVQRSCDVPLGVPMNISSYALLLLLVARITGHKPGMLNHFLWNIHIYEDQYETAIEQMGRVPNDPPKIEINENIRSLNDLETWVTTDDFKIVDYNHQGALKYEFSA